MLPFVRNDECLGEDIRGHSGGLTVLKREVTTLETLMEEHNVHTMSPSHVAHSGVPPGPKDRYG